MMHCIADIDWSKRTPVGMGGYAVVYRVAPGVVAKVGHIEPEEVAAQRHFAGQALALPVLDYREAWPVPDAIDREACPVHGLRRQILPEGHSCTCGSDHGVLLMPEADLSVDTTSAEYTAFVLGFLRDCLQQLGHCWDARPANVARYGGNLVALDFGEEEGFL
ncbi:MAG: hypothetical protein DPW09_02995 [Anaerolineae bacterium]|nr:hypothetical protein [Anaerolineae bacterium]